MYALPTNVDVPTMHIQNKEVSDMSEMPSYLHVACPIPPTPASSPTPTPTNPTIDNARLNCSTLPRGVPSSPTLSGLHILPHSPQLPLPFATLWKRRFLPDPPQPPLPLGAPHPPISQASPPSRSRGTTSSPASPPPDASSQL